MKMKTDTVAYNQNRPDTQEVMTVHESQASPAQDGHSKLSLFK